MTLIAINLSSLANSGRILLSPCIMCVQYIGGCSGMYNTLGGYHEYIVGIS